MIGDLNVLESYNYACSTYDFFDSNHCARTCILHYDLLIVSDTMTDIGFI